MKIYPKLSAQKFGKEMEEIILKSEGIEIQFFNENGITEEFNFEDEIRRKKLEFPNLKEIVVHPPLDDYHLELLMMKDEKIVEKQLKKLVELSEELDIKMAIIYHTLWTKNQYVSTNLATRLKNLLKIVEGKRVVVLIENLFMMLDELKGCSALEICKTINHPNLKMCLDTTHAHCKANIWKLKFEEMLENDFNPEDCAKYVKQIHFAATLDNDGYTKKETHGRVHPNIDEVKKELEWLNKYKMLDKNFITEVSEEDYYSRKDQIREIEMLKKLNQEE